MSISVRAASSIASCSTGLRAQRKAHIQVSDDAENWRDLQSLAGRDRARRRLEAVATRAWPLCARADDAPSLSLRIHPE